MNPKIIQNELGPRKGRTKFALLFGEKKIRKIINDKFFFLFYLLFILRIWYFILFLV